jgi:DNA-directed RNA polymerase specialized sigma24 family protein
MAAVDLVMSSRTPAPGDIDAFCAEHNLFVRERAEKLCISLDTVKSHVSRIYRKTAAAGRTDLLYRIRLGRL